MAAPISAAQQEGVQAIILAVNQGLVGTDETELIRVSRETLEQYKQVREQYGHVYGYFLERSASQLQLTAGTGVITTLMRDSIAATEGSSDIVHSPIFQSFVLQRLPILIQSMDASDVANPENWRV